LLELNLLYIFGSFISPADFLTLKISLNKNYRKVHEPHYLNITVLSWKHQVQFVQLPIFVFRDFHSFCVVFDFDDCPRPVVFLRLVTVEFPRLCFVVNNVLLHYDGCCLVCFEDDGNGFGDYAVII